MFDFDYLTTYLNYFNYLYDIFSVDLDNLFIGWVRYTVGEGRMMEEAPGKIINLINSYNLYFNQFHEIRLQKSPQ